MSFGRFVTFKKKRVYLDYAAATPVRPEVVEAMQPYFTEHFGNPSAIHREGQYARDAVEATRESIARLLAIRSPGVYFTGSGTEANNLALYGSVRACLASRSCDYSDVAIVSTRIEHPSILRVLEDLARCGVDVRYVDVDADGCIDEEQLQSLLDSSVVLVSFAYANSEIGVVQNVKRLTRIVKKHNAEHNTEIRTHLDAAQAPLWLPLEMDMLGVDLMSLDGGKCYGPKGVGVLAVRHGVTLAGVLLGGGQEDGKRAGTENTPLIVGFGKALQSAVDGRESRCVRVRALRDALIMSLTKQIEGCVLNGTHEQRIANNVNISIPGLDAEFAVVTLDVHGIAASTKSACGGADGAGSEVVRIISDDKDRAQSTLRFTLGEETIQRDIARVVDVLSAHVAEMRAFRQTLT